MKGWSRVEKLLLVIIVLLAVNVFATIQATIYACHVATDGGDCYGTLVTTQVHL